MAGLAWRLGRAEDIDQIASVVNQAYRGQEGWTNESRILSGLRVNEAFLKDFFSSTAPADKAILVFFTEEDKDRIVGTVCLEKESRSASLGMFSVLPSLQNKGYGRRILEAAEEFVRKTWLEVDQMEMGVITQRKELIEWYERRGYRCTGKIIPFPYDNPEVGKPLIEDMTLTILEKPLSSA